MSAVLICCLGTEVQWAEKHTPPPPPIQNYIFAFHSAQYVGIYSLGTSCIFSIFAFLLPFPFPFFLYLSFFLSCFNLFLLTLHTFSPVTHCGAGGGGGGGGAIFQYTVHHCLKQPGFKGILRRKLRWVMRGINRQLYYELIFVLYLKGNHPVK
jgi:hypothetical protein